MAVFSQYRSQDTHADAGAKALLEDDKVNWKFSPARDGRPAYYLYESEIQKSENDEREYRVIRLENGLEAVLVHDKETDKAAASLNVAVGHFSDPDDIPGLAHFCEHLLFMGTEKFPKENEYAEYLARNNGDYNAYTAGDDTTHFFTVKYGALKGALERFAAFFHCPLFDEGTTMREVLAVDSENSNYLQDDDWRTDQIVRGLARSGHPLRKFGVGNKKTLVQTGTKNSRAPYDNKSKGEESEEGKAARETRRRVIEWWEKEYGAERMHLVIIGRESLDQLTDWATTLFSPIKNRGQDPLPRLPEEPYGKEQLSSAVYVKTITDVNNVSIAFPIIDQPPLWRIKPAEFLAHLIGHEGPGSLYAYLKKKGWACTLGAHTQEMGRGISSFALCVELTRDGLKNYREVIQTCFKYISLLRSSKLPSLYQEELITLQSLGFRFDEKVSADIYAQHIVRLMQLPIPRALPLSGPRLTWGWDEQLVHRTLADLIIDNSLIIITSQDLSVIGKNGPWTKEPWYGTQYMVEKLDGELLNAVREDGDIPELALPKPNEFIPTNIEVGKVNVPGPKKRPALIQRDALKEVWFKRDDRFWVPRTQVLIEAKTPLIVSTARAYVMTRLFTYLVEDALTEYSYDAHLAGLSYDFSIDLRGVYLSLGGYSDKLHVLAQHVMEKIKNLVIKEDRLELMKEKAQQELANLLLNEPYLLSGCYLSYLLADHDFTPEEQLVEMPEITVEKLREHVGLLLSQLKVKFLVNGNLTREDALGLASMFEKIIDAGPVPENKIILERSRLLPTPCNYIYERAVRNADEINSSVSYYCHIGRISDAQVRVTCRLLDRILQEPAFDILRTKEQLGYIVMSVVMEGIESIGWHITIQSKKDTKYVESRVEVFLVHMRGVLDNMEEREFEEHKEAIIHEWTEKPKNLIEESCRFWSNIRGGYYDFLSRERDAELTKNVDKEHVLDMFKTFLDPASPSRSKLSVHMRSQTPPICRLSRRASEEFSHVLRKAGVAIDEEKYASLCKEMSEADAKGYWEEALLQKLGSMHKAKKLWETFGEVIDKYPVEKYGPVELDTNVVFIKDGREFRESLALTASARPVADFEVV